MGSEVTIREAQRADLPLLVRFNVAMAAETEALDLDPARVAHGAEAVLDDPSLGCYWLVEAEGAVVGGLMITWEWSDWRDGCFWWIQSVYVEPAWRRQGLFRRLYDAVRERARLDPKCCGLRLYVERDNATAQRTYLDLGMVETAYRLFEEEFDR